MLITKRLKLRKCPCIDGRFYEDEDNRAWICASFVIDWMLGGCPDELIVSISDEGHGDFMKIRFDFAYQYWYCGSFDRGPLLSRTSKLIEETFDGKTELYFNLREP